jgi:regulator of sigma E protease
MTFLYIFPILVLLNIIYTVGFLAAQLFTKAHHEHYFLGYNPGLIAFSIRKVKFTFGIFIPVIGISRIYFIHAGKKHTFYPWQFTSVSILKRLFVTYGGVLSLFFVGVVMSVIAVYISDEKFISKEEVNKHGIYPSENARAVGFLPGDKVVALNGSDYKDFYELVSTDVVQSPETYYTILRGSDEMLIKMSDLPATGQHGHQMFLQLNAPFSVGEVMPGSPAALAEIHEGDKIVKVNNNPLVSLDELNTLFQADEDGTVLLEIERIKGSSKQKLEKVVLLNASKKLGFIAKEEIQYEPRMYSLLQSIFVGVKRFFVNLFSQWQGIRKMIGMAVPGSEQKLGGPIKISALAEQDLHWWIYFTYMYTGFVIVLNFLPFPKSAMLEVIPLSYEALAKKPFSYKSFWLIRQISICLFGFLILLQLTMDLIKLF